jgi:hypothetical protein
MGAASASQRPVRAVLLVSAPKAVKEDEEMEAEGDEGGLAGASARV